MDQIKMKRNWILFLIAFALLFALAGCGASTSATSGVSKASTSTALDGINRNALPSYSAMFEIHFNGTTNWVYQLQTRKSKTMREEKLSIQGVDKNQNPGDIRLVTDGSSTWMIGAGTDNECVRFPNGQGMDPELIYPETVTSWESLGSALKSVGEEPVLGKTSVHYQAKGVTIGTWKEAQVDVWKDKDSHELLRYWIQASGEDPFFNGGSGALKARYEVQDLKEAAIEPVSGCEINIPVPDKTTNLVRLPGVASFESPMGVEEVSQYFQAALPKENWALSEPAAQANGATVLSFARAAETVEIHIEAGLSGGSKVKLLFQNGQ